MSGENVEIVRRGVEAAMQRPKPDWKAVRTIYDAEHEFHSLVEQVDGAHARGAKGWSDWLRRTNETGNWDSEIEDVLDAPGGRVVVVLRFWWCARASGLQQEQRIAVVATVHAGKIVRTDSYESPGKALQAVGLPS